MRKRRIVVIKYEHIKGIGISGLEVLSNARWGRQLWVEVKVRKEHKCVITGLRIIKGATVFRPLSNAGNRYERISQEGMLQLKE